MLSLGVGSAVGPTIAGLHHVGIGFDLQFLGLAGSVSVMMFAAWFLPRLHPGIAAAPATTPDASRL